MCGCVQIDRCLTGGEQTLDRFGLFTDPHVWLRNNYNMRDVQPQVGARTHLDLELCLYQPCHATTAASAATLLPCDACFCVEQHLRVASWVLTIVLQLVQLMWLAPIHCCNNRQTGSCVGPAGELCKHILQAQPMCTSCKHILQAHQHATDACNQHQAADIGSWSCWVNLQQAAGHC